MLVITWHLLTSLNMVLTHMHCTARDKPPQLSACKLPELSCENSFIFPQTPPPFFFFFFAATLTYDTLRFVEFEDFPETSEPVWILGKEYNALTGGTWIFSHENFNTYETHHKVSHSVLSLWCGYVVICRCLYCRERWDFIRCHFTPVVHIQKKLPTDWSVLVFITSVTRF